MRRVIQRTQFLRDLKKMRRRGKGEEKIFSLVRLIANKGHLPTQYKPHKLSGEYLGLWECHIEPDWLLVYDLDEKSVFIYRTGTHEDLFG